MTKIFHILMIFSFLFYHRCTYKSHASSTALQEEFDLAGGEDPSTTTVSSVLGCGHNCIRLHLKHVTVFPKNFTTSSTLQETLYRKMRVDKMSCFTLFHQYEHDIRVLTVRKLLSSKPKYSSNLTENNVFSYLIRSARKVKSTTTRTTTRGERQKRGNRTPRGDANRENEKEEEDTMDVEVGEQPVSTGGERRSMRRRSGRT